MKTAIEFIRAIVRPLLALTAAVGTFILLICHIPVPDAWWAFLGVASTFYFLQRAAEKANERNGTPPTP